MANKIVIGILLLVSIAMFFYGLTQQIAAERESQNATKVIEQSRNELQSCLKVVQEQQAIAEDYLRLTSEALKKCQEK